MEAELVNRYLADMKADLQKTRGARKFVDVAAEGEPRFPTEEEADEDREVAQLRLVEDDEPRPLGITRMRPVTLAPSEGCE